MIKLLFSLFFLISVSGFAGHGGKDALEVVTDDNLEIEMTYPEWVDVGINSGSSEGTGDPNESVTSLRKKKVKHSSEKTAEEKTGGRDSISMDDSQTRNEKTEPETLRAYLNFKGKDGWATFKVDPKTGKALGGQFSSQFDPEGTGGETIPMSESMGNGQNIPLTKESISNFTINQQGSTLGPVKDVSGVGQIGC